MLDNTTAIAYINHMGGTHSKVCQQISMKIWQWAEAHSIWISAAHIPGVKNLDADKLSRKKDDNKEWSITSDMLNAITDVLGLPNIDLFASRTNKKLNVFVSWNPDPDSLAIDSFTLNWSNYFPYCFPPFSKIGDTIRKLREDYVMDAILIVPLWSTQSWYPIALNMLTYYPVVFQADRSNPGLQLVAMKLSASFSKAKDFLRKQRKSLLNPGDQVPGTDTKMYLKNGKSFVTKGTLIPYIQL